MKKLIFTIALFSLTFSCKKQIIKSEIEKKWAYCRETYDKQATLQKLVEAGKIDPDEVTVVYITGNGLKTLEALKGELSEPFTIDPKLDEFERALERSRTLERLEWQQAMV